MDFQKLHFHKSNESPGKSNQNQHFQSSRNLSRACKNLRSINSRKMRFMAFLLALYLSSCPQLCGGLVTNSSQAVIAVGIIGFKLFIKSHLQSIVIIWPVLQFPRKAWFTGTVIIWPGLELILQVKNYHLHLFNITASWGCSANWGRQESGQKFKRKMRDARCP